MITREYRAISSVVRCQTGAAKGFFHFLSVPVLFLMVVGCGTAEHGRDRDAASVDGFDTVSETGSNDISGTDIQGDDANRDAAADADEGAGASDADVYDEAEQVIPADIVSDAIECLVGDTTHGEDLCNRYEGVGTGCPTGWDPKGDECIPSDCERSAWYSGRCSTAQATVLVTRGTPWNPDSPDGHCPDDQEALVFYDGFGSPRPYCLSVPRIRSYFGLYHTQDGGRSWASAPSVGYPPFEWLDWPFKLLRSKALPDLVIVFHGELRISEDAGVNYTATSISGLGGMADAAVSPDGRTLFVLGFHSTNTVVQTFDLPSGKKVLDMVVKIPRYMGAVWSIRPLSNSRALISARIRESATEGFRAVVEVDLEKQKVALVGPEFDSVASQSVIATSDSDGPIYLIVDVVGTGPVLFRYLTEKGEWEERGLAPVPGELRVVAGDDEHLVGDRARSLDGGRTWQNFEQASIEDQFLYAGIIGGDRICTDACSPCESWSYLLETGGLNIRAPSLVWHRSDDQCPYKHATGNLPFIQALPGFEVLGPIGLAPMSLLALGNGRAVVALGNRMPQ